LVRRGEEYKPQRKVFLFDYSNLTIGTKGNDSSDASIRASMKTKDAKFKMTQLRVR
jgi:hypothetical protein